MSSEDFKSFIVTNPDLVDEGIDISGLNTTTDTSPFLLGNIPGGPGLQYSSIDPTRYSDLIRFYSQGLPMLDTPQAVAPVVDTTSVVDTGGGGGMDQATGGLDLGGNTDFEQSLLDQGIGVQGAIGDPVVAPGEIPVTQQEMDDFNAIPVTQPMTGGITGDPIEVEDLINYQDPSSSDESGLDMSGTIGGAQVVGDFDEPTTIQGSLSQDQVPNLDYSQADIDAERLGSYTPSFDTPEQTNAIGDAFNSVKDLGVAGVNNFKDSLIALGGKVREGFDGTIEIAGQTIDLAESLKSGVISLVGKALTSVPALGLVASLLPKGGRSDMANKLGEQYGMDDIGRLTGGPMAGYAVDSLMGDGIEQATIDRINSIKNRTAPQTESSEKKIQELEEFLEQIERNKTAIDYDIEGTDEGDRADEERDTNIDAGIQAADDDSGSEMLGTPTDEFSDDEFMAGDTSIAAPATGDTAIDSFFDAADNAATSSPGLTDAQKQANSDAAIDAARGGGGSSGTLTQAQSTANIDAARGGGGGGDNKIVCTMMNDSYGFGSFRNKIWLKHSKDMAPEYQIGYHKIFLPLIKIAKTNKVVKKVLEHIAVHRTIDIRQESRGKTHLLGRVYRKILEPICYLVGKYAK